MAKKKSSYRRDGKGIHEDEKRLKKAGLHPKVITAAPLNAVRNPNPRISNGLSFVMFGLYRLTWRPSDGKCEIWFGSWKMGYRPIARGTISNHPELKRSIIDVKVTPECMPEHHIPKVIMRKLMEEYGNTEQRDRDIRASTDIG